MTQRTLILLLSLCFALTGMAQADFPLKVPPFKKYMKITATDVNLRKGPGTNYPRLVEQPDDPYSEGFFEMMTIWTNSPLKKYQKAVRADGKVLPVRSESGEWVELQLTYNGNVDSWTEKVWTMKKFCKEMKLRPITQSDLRQKVDPVLHITEGKYKDICLEFQYGGMDTPETIRVGKYVDGKYVFNYMIPVLYNEDTVQPRFGHNPYWTQEGSIGVYWFYYGKSLCIEDWDDGINLKKMAANSDLMYSLVNLMNKIAANTSLMKEHYDSYAIFGVEGERNIYTLQGF